MSSSADKLPATPDLDEAELQRRARGVALVLTDCDGVLTDGAVYYSESGEALKRFSLRDGMGVERLRDAGVATGLITREKTGFAARRAEKLRLPHVYLGVHDKRATLPRILEEAGVEATQLAYIGDDVNDLEIMREVGVHGLAATPNDGVAQLDAVAHLRTRAPGGAGAFREFAEWLLALREGSQPPPAPAR